MRYRPIDALLDSVLPDIRALRHDLHRHPELGFAEERTSARVREALAALPGWELKTGLAKTGLIATLGRNLPGPALALRADMDALPIEEQSGVPHTSTRPGVMHACGHDGHTAMLVGVARVLSELTDELAGPVRLIFQPAEESGAGGRRMVEEAALRDPDVAAIFGLHNFPSTIARAGQICHCPGAAMAGTATFEITVRGRGGHAAAPHLTVDPIYLGSEIIASAQSLVSRRTDPIRSVVISFTQFHAGNTYNVIPETAVLRGTIRALDEGDMASTASRLRDQVEGLARALGGSADLQLMPDYPVTRNHPRSDRIFREVIREIGREKDFLEIGPIMGGEDFSFYQQKIPGTFWFLASRPAEVAEVPGWHHPAFDFNDAVLGDGIRVHVELARRFAGLWKEPS